jgi:hypothetical protein
MALLLCADYSIWHQLSAGAERLPRGLQRVTSKLAVERARRHWPAPEPRLAMSREEKLQSLSAQLRSRDVLIEKMRLELAHLKRMKFGRSSEQLDEKIAQLEFSLEDLEARIWASLHWYHTLICH